MFERSLRSSLEAQNNLVESLFDLMAQWAFVTDDTLGVVSANAAARDALGLPIEALRRRQLGSLLVRTDPPGTLEAAFSHCANRGATLRFRAFLIDDGFEREFSIRGLFPEAGAASPGGFLVVGGERCPATAPGGGLELARAIIAGLRVPAFLATRHEAVEDFNAAFASFAKADESAIAGRSARELFEDGPIYKAFRAARLESFHTGRAARRGVAGEAGGSARPALDLMVAKLPGAGNHAPEVLCVLEPAPPEASAPEEVADLMLELSDVVRRLVAVSERSPHARRAGEPSLSMDSPRKDEIARRVIAGETTKQIAAELQIAESTVKNHLSAMYKRLGVSSRPAFILRMTRRLK